MRIIAAISAGLLAAATFAAIPADAQSRGYGYERGRDRSHDRGWRDDRGRRWNNGHRVRTRTVCRTVRGYYGPVRRCFRVRR